MKTLYQKTKIISRVKKYFEPYLELLAKPTGHKLFMLLLAILSMQAVTSIAHIYKWFLSPLAKISQSSYYYLMTYTPLPLDKFAAVTIRLAISLIAESHKHLPVLLLLDDTLQEKFGTKFECCSKLFDHAKHNGSLYLNGHCFVALAICIPLTIGNTVKYLTVPIRFRLREKDENKLTIASEMITEAMKSLKDISTVILLADSWYPKGKVLETVELYENLEFIANVRVDSAIFALPERTGKRGRPPKRGKKLDIYSDFSFTEVGKFFIAAQMVMTNLFDNPVYMTVTTPNIDNHKSYRLFLSTITPDKLYALFSQSAQTLDNDTKQVAWLLPLELYSFRWNIEVMFYELKTFWSFGSYRLRSKQGINNFINIISMAYASAKLIPCSDSFFSDFSDLSPQTTKYAFGEAIRKELFFAQFVDFVETRHISLEQLHDFDILDVFAQSY
jgi:hypothetical protein